MQELSTQERLARFYSFLDRDPENAGLTLTVAKLELAGGQSDKATEHARQALALDDQLAGAHAVLAVAAANRQQHEETIAHATDAFLLGERDPQLAFCMANALAHQERYEEALEPAQAAAAHPEQCPHAAALYVRILHRLERYQDATAYIETLGAAALTLPKLQSVLSTLYIDSEQIEAAAEAAAAALAMDAKDSEAGTTAAFLRLAALDHEGAANHFTGVLSTQPQFGRAQLGMGLSSMLAGDLDQAAIMLRQATLSLKNHLGTWQALAWCQILKRDGQGAKDTLLEALEIDRSFAETHGTLAVVAVMQGDVGAAEELAHTSLRLDRRNFPGNFALSLLKQLSGDDRKAELIVERLLSEPIFPDGKTVQQMLAEGFASTSMGRPSKSIDVSQ